MDNIERNIKGPRHAVAFYVKVYSNYFKKINPKIKPKQILTDAVKSWVTLSETEKLEFKNKFNDCKEMFRKKVADQLKYSVPYLKEKRKTDTTVNNIVPIVQNNGLADADITETENISNDETFIGSRLIEDTQEQEVTKEIIIPEPTPPLLLCAADLYNMIKKDNTETRYSDLELTEKRRYRSAVLAIKRNYIKQYKVYLESLSDKKLVAHYRKVKND